MHFDDESTIPDNRLNRRRSGIAGFDGDVSLVGADVEQDALCAFIGGVDNTHDVDKAN